MASRPEQGALSQAEPVQSPELSLIVLSETHLQGV
jgi:hypothetical protein